MWTPGHSAATLLTNGARISGQLLKLDLCIPLLIITGTGIIQIAFNAARFSAYFATVAARLFSLAIIDFLAIVLGLLGISRRF